MTRRALPVFAAALVVLVAVAWAATHAGPPSPADQANAIAEGLRCPVCVAQSVAASTSPAAQQMRTEIDRQVAAGRSPEQIREWFAATYGPQVLLSPAPDGLGAFAQAAPGVALVAGVGALWWFLRRERRREAVA